MIRVLSAMVVVGLLAGSAFAADAKFPLKGDNTKLTFVGTKPDGKHDGSFKELTGTATIADNDVTKLKIEVEIDLNSMETDDPKLTTHLKSPDFFNVKANPKAKFVTTKVEKANDDYSVTGDLTLNGKTKPVTFPAKIKASDDPQFDEQFQDQPQ